MENSHTVRQTMTSTLNNYEFEYPLHSTPRRINTPYFLKHAKYAPQQINTPYFLKHAKYWDFNLKSEHDLKELYNSLQLRLHDYNILIKPFSKLIIEDSIPVST